VTETKNNLTT